MNYRLLVIACISMVSGVSGALQASSLGQTIVTLDVDSRVNALEFDRDGKSLIAACGQFVGLLQEPRPGHVVLWDLRSRKARLDFDAHADGVSCVHFLNNGETFVTGSYDGEVKWWNSMTGANLGVLNPKIGAILSLAVSSNGKQIVLGGWSGNQENMHSFAVCDLPSRKVIGTVPAHQDAVSSVLFLRDDRYDSGILTLFNRFSRLIKVSEG